MEFPGRNGIPNWVNLVKASQKRDESWKMITTFNKIPGKNEDQSVWPTSSVRDQSLKYPKIYVSKLRKMVLLWTFCQLIYHTYQWEKLLQSKVVQLLTPCYQHLVTEETPGETSEFCCWYFLFSFHQPTQKKQLPALQQQKTRLTSTDDRPTHWGCFFSPQKG